LFRGNHEDQRAVDGCARQVLAPTEGARRTLAAPPNFPSAATSPHPATFRFIRLPGPGARTAPPVRGLPGDGRVLDDEGRRVRFSLDRYADEGAREETWFVPGVRKVYRTLATLINGLVDAGLVVGRVVEPVPSEQWLQVHPRLRDARRRPVFLLVRARQPGP
jgi:hypothetical protein